MSAEDPKHTKTDYSQKRTKLTKVKLADRGDGLFNLRPSFPSLPSVKRFVFVCFGSSADIAKGGDGAKSALW
jgi:hypothetical protein